MKKKTLVLLIILVLCISLSACKKDEEEKEKVPEAKTNEKIDLKKNVSIQDVGYVVGNYDDRHVIVKVSNNNDRAIYVDVKFSYRDSNGNQLDERNVYVRVGAHKTAYAIDEFYVEDVYFDNYKYDFDVSLEKLDDYETIYNNMKVNYVDTGSKVNVTITNNGNRTSTVKAWVLFRKDGKVVALNSVSEYNLTPGNTKTQSINYPHKTNSILIPFDRIEVVLNEISTEL